MEECACALGDRKTLCQTEPPVLSIWEALQGPETLVWSGTPLTAALGRRCGRGEPFLSRGIAKTLLSFKISSASGRVCGQRSDTSSTPPRILRCPHAWTFMGTVTHSFVPHFCPQESFLLEVPLPCRPLPSITPPLGFPHRFFSAHLTLGFQTPPCLPVL